MEIEVDLVDLEIEPSAENCGTRRGVWREELHQLRRHLKSVVVVLTAGPYHQHCQSPRKMSLRLRSRQSLRRTKKSRSLQSRGKEGSAEPRLSGTPRAGVSS